MKRLILNADVGEEAGFDHQIMPYVSWCNISCGAHAGDDEVITNTINLATKYDVKIGAHPSYPDRVNFGRVSMDMLYSDLVRVITEQIMKVKYYTEKIGHKLHHVKPHGALYNDAVNNEKIASAIIEAIKNVDERLCVLTLSGSVLSSLCEDVLLVKHEAFADRNYNDDLTLVSRTKNNALIENPEEAFDHVFKMVSKGVVCTRNGVEKLIFFDTICVHGDNPKSINILEYIHHKFLDLGYDLN